MNRRRWMYLSEDKIITKDTNAPLMALLYSAGLCRNPNYMTRKEGNAVTNIPKNFALNNTALTSIDELKYFENCTVLKNSAFKGCSNLSILNFPPNLTTIERAVFSNCTSIVTVTLPDTVTTLGDSGSGETFSNCSNLTTINLDNVSTIYQWGLYKCPKLNDYGFTGNITTLGPAYIWFEGTIRSLFLPSLTSKQFGAWRGGNKVTVNVIDIGAKVAAIEMGLRAVQAPIVLRASTPPILTASTQTEYITSIYVPASSLSAYLSSDWNTRYPNKIFAIGGSEWQIEFAEAPNPADEYADVRLYAPSKYIDAYIEKYELSKS